MATRGRKRKKEADFVEKIQKKERTWFKEWNPEIMLVTVVGVLMILGLSVVAAAKIGEVHDTLARSNQELNNKISALNTKITGLNNEILTLKASSGGCLFELNQSNQTLCTVKDKVDKSLAGVQMKLPLESNILCSDNTMCLPEHGKARILRFVSPTCPYCHAQEPILQEISQKYPEVEVKNVCFPIHQGDDQLCKENADAYDIDYETGLELAKQFHVSGTPTLVIDCVYKRTGSYALYDQMKNTSYEKEDLENLFKALSA